MIRREFIDEQGNINYIYEVFNVMGESFFYDENGEKIGCRIRSFRNPIKRLINTIYQKKYEKVAEDRFYDRTLRKDISNCYRNAIFID